MTPRQLLGVLRFAEADAKREMGENLALQATAARAEAKAIMSALRELSSDRPA
ncbi:MULTISPECIES: hypothetical protein [unclassified Mesorhizobium]|uniref:hypothetical protein n=1 Tax=unclassified Mesorhizobium TaxID=325217 RepID=UPI001679EBC5|nr:MULTISPECIES: hypothetical protein [unclassified Mesorhizobium]